MDARDERIRQRIEKIVGELEILVEDIDRNQAVIDDHFEELYRLTVELGQVYNEKHFWEA